PPPCPPDRTPPPGLMADVLPVTPRQAQGLERAVFVAFEPAAPGGIIGHTVASLQASRDRPACAAWRRSRRYARAQTRYATCIYLSIPRPTCTNLTRDNATCLWSGHDHRPRLRVAGLAP